MVPIPTGCPTALALLLLAASLSAQTSATCDRPDPVNYNQVLACMSSYRYGGLGNGRGVFEQTAMTSCVDISSNYRAALVASRIPRDEANSLAMLPSCDLLARALQAITGRPTFWARCTDYPGHFDPAHMQACLDQFLPGYYGSGKTLASLNGCADATREYEIALRSATQQRFHNPSRAGDMPPDYEKPDCAKVAALLGGKGSPCLGWQPGIPHLQQCLGPEVSRYTACIPLRQRYEQTLREAYGGGLPPGYVILSCGELASLTDAAQARQAALRAQASERARQQQAARDHASGSPNGLRGFFSMLFFTWLGTPFFVALAVHGALSIWALLYAGQQIRSGRWVITGNPLAAIVYERLFRWKLLAAHTALLLAGWWFTHWPWLVGAFVVVPLTRIALVILMAVGIFKAPRRRPGPVDVEGSPVTPEASGSREKEMDQGVSDDWKA